MAIDLLNIQPTVITRDLSNKYILLAAPYKYGKTTFMSSIPNALVLSFEPGLNAQAGVYAQKVLTWNDMKIVARELKRPEVQQKYTTVCFDTIDIAAQLCQDYVCASAGVTTLGEVPYGKLYDQYKIEFSKVIRGIANLGYGCVFACHTEIKELPTNQENITIERLQPKLDKRAFDLINSLVDIIGVGVMEFDGNGQQKRVLYTQETPTVRAGARFKYLPSKIDFSYEALIKALSEAIDKEEQFKSGSVVDKVEVEEELNFDDLLYSARRLWANLVGSGEEAKPQVALTILNKVRDITGKDMKLSDFTEANVKELAQVVNFMEDMA